MAKTIGKNGVPNDADRIAQFFIGKHVFITGGTGFLGKVMVEKLLRDCSEVATIYLLIRDKKGKNPSQRIEEIFNSPLFEMIRNTRPNAIKQLKAICGDVTLPDLGISDADRALLIEKVNIVYHCAATTRFDETLKKAVILNTRGTHLMVELSEKFKNLDAFVHVSTAYCNLHVPLLREQLYDPPADPHQIIKLAETMDDSIMQQMEKQILGSIPNTYVYTKALSEGIIAKKMNTMKCIIVRPSIVLPIWKEPIPGWTDNINGPTGLLIAAAKGVLRTMLCQEKGYADFFPVDIAVNAFITSTWNYVENKDLSRRVYNVTSSAEFKVTWAEIINRGKKILQKIPLNNCAWYPGGTMKTSRLHHNIALIFTHWVPAYLLDGILFLAGQKRFMVRVQERITSGMTVFEYFANNQWDFIHDNLVYMRGLQSKREKEKYAITGDDLNINDYFENCTSAARIYLLKEMPDTLPAARRHMRIMYWVDVIFKMLFCYLMFYLVTSYSETAKNASDYAFDYVKSYIPPSIMSSES